MTPLQPDASRGNTPVNREPAAIVGLGCRFPGANNPDEFWQLLCRGEDAVGEIPADRWRDVERLHHPRPGTPGKMSSRQGGYLPGIDRFDAEFFGILPREAERLDPQQRILLETAWEALEDAGQVPSQLTGSSTGVFVGLWVHDYETHLIGDPLADDLRKLDFYTTIGTGHYASAGRLSFALGLQGPSISCDTACSSSLVAVNSACQSLWCGECDMALAGGVNVILSPYIAVAYSQAKIISPDGRCKFGDARANGYVRSEGCGLIVLKTLSRAVADGDRIYAVIRGGSVNNDGRTSHMLAAPGCLGQQDVLRKAYRQAGVSPADVQYVEAHGTGTPVGDPIELAALAAVLGEGRPSERPCLIGSVKTNIGHTEAASGIAGLMKVALALKHRTIPASLHFKNPNQNIPWSSLPLSMVTEQTPWPAHVGPALAGINSYGIAGTNAHIVLAEPPREPATDAMESAFSLQEMPLYVLPLSAKTPAALRALAAAWEPIIGADSAEAIEDICYTAALKREHHPLRLTLVGADRGELVEQLRAFVADETAHLVPQSAEPRKVAFVYSGQGAQWIGMARQLHAQPVFRAALESCDRLLAKHAGWSLIDELATDESKSRMNQTEVAQPAIFAIQVALTELWSSWGIRPDAVVGHSIGEVAAAHVAGVLSLEEAIRVVYHRSRLMQQATGHGRMVAVQLTQAAAELLVADYPAHLAVGAVNGPESVVLSGTPEAVEEVVRTLEARGVWCRLLPVDYAFHSPQMEAHQAELTAALAGLETRPPRIPIVSTVTGEFVVGDARNLPAFGAEYWALNIRQPVRFAAAMQQLVAAGHRTFVEIAPHAVLARDIESASSPECEVVAFPSMRRDADAWRTMLTSLAELHMRGGSPNWPALVSPNGKFVSLPTYPWQRKRHWLDHRSARGTQRGGHPLLGACLSSAAEPGTHFWQVELTAAKFPYLYECEIGGVLHLSAAFYVELMLEAAKQLSPAEAIEIRNLQLVPAATLAEGEATSLQVIAVTGESETLLEIYAQRGHVRHASAWSLLAQATVAPPTSEIPAAANGELPAAAAATANESLGRAAFYDAAVARQRELGPAFQGVQSYRTQAEGAVGELRIADEALDADARAHAFYPPLADSALQIAARLAGDRQHAHAAQTPESSEPWIVGAVERIVVHASLPVNEVVAAEVLSREQAASSTTWLGDIRLHGEGGQLLAELCGVTLLPLSAARHPSRQLAKQPVAWTPARLSAEQPAAGGYLAAPADIAAHVNGQPLPAALVEDENMVERLLPQLERLAMLYAVDALRTLGFAFKHGQHIEPVALMAELGIAPRNRRLLERIFQILTEDGILEPEGANWRVAQTPPAIDPLPVWQALSAEYTSCWIELELFGRAGQSLRGILQGEIDPITMLFPDGSLTSAAALYRDTCFSRAANYRLRAALAEAIARVPADRKIRVLEIGAGTGGMTHHVLPLLPAERSEYHFTDVGNLFLSKAQETFAQYPFVTYTTLDIERDPFEQGFAPGSFDLVLAANCLHATRSMRKTMARVRELLAPQGLMMLIEGSDRRRWTDLAFGSIEGWWLFEDRDLRTDHPLLSAGGWNVLLDAVGFDNVGIVGGTRAAECELFPQSIVIAREPAWDPTFSAPQPWMQEPGEWVVLAGSNSLAKRLELLLRACHQSVVVLPVSQDESGESSNLRQRLKATLAGIKQPLRGVVDLRFLDGDAVVSAIEAGRELEALLAEISLDTTPRLVVVVPGASELATANETKNVLWVELDTADAAAAYQLLIELVYNRVDFQVAYRHGARHVLREIESTTRRARPTGAPRLLSTVSDAAGESNANGLADVESGTARTKPVALRDALAGATSDAARQQVIESHVQQQLAHLLRLPLAQLDRNKSFKLMGLDSLTALGLQNRLQTTTELKLTPATIWSYATISALAGYLAEQMADGVTAG